MQAITLQLHTAIKSKAYNIKWDCIRRAQRCQRIGGTEQQQVSPPPLHNAQQLFCEPRGSSPLGREGGRKKQRCLYHSGLHGYGRSPAPAVGKDCHTSWTQTPAQACFSALNTCKMSIAAIFSPWYLSTSQLRHPGSRQCFLFYFKAA